MIPLIVLGAWLALSVPVALFIGAFFRFGARLEKTSEKGAPDRQFVGVRS